MQPTQNLLNRTALLLADDAETLAHPTDPPKVHLIKEAFNPGLTLDVQDLDVCDFSDYAPKEAVAGSQQTYSDPSNGDILIQMTEPEGGWYWQVGISATNLPQSVHGFVVTNNDASMTYGSSVLAQPVELTSSGQGLNLPQVQFRVKTNGIE